jgi:Fur family zinc uptake transcriptional regulator
MHMTLSAHNHRHCQDDLIARAERICEERGSRLTGQRRDILVCVAEDHGAVGAYDIIEKMAKKGVRHAPVTVYRALEFLRAHGLVHKVESRNAFIACLHEHDEKPAALLICRACNGVEEVDAEAVHKELDQLAAVRRFRPEITIIEMTGLCQGCEAGGN